MGREEGMMTLAEMWLMKIDEAEEVDCERGGKFYRFWESELERPETRVI